MKEQNTLTLQGEKYRVEVSLEAIRLFCRDKGITDLAEFDKVKLTSFEDAELLIYYSLYSGAKVSGKVLAIKKENMGEYLRVKDITAFMNIYRHQADISYKESKKISRFQRFENWLNNQ